MISGVLAQRCGFGTCGWKTVGRWIDSDAVPQGHGFQLEEFASCFRQESGCPPVSLGPPGPPLGPGPVWRDRLPTAGWTHLVTRARRPATRNDCKPVGWPHLTDPPGRTATRHRSRGRAQDQPGRRITPEARAPGPGLPTSHPGPRGRPRARGAETLQPSSWLDSYMDGRPSRAPRTRPFKGNSHE